MISDVEKSKTRSERFIVQIGNKSYNVLVALIDKVGSGAKEVGGTIAQYASTATQKTAQFAKGMMGRVMPRRFSGRNEVQ